MNRLLDYVIKEKLYEDDTIIVHRGNRISDNIPVIIKQPAAEHPDLNYRLCIKHEFEANKLLSSNLIVKAYDLIELNNMPILIIEDFGGITLRSLFNSRNLSIHDFLDISIKIASALADIHKANIVHNSICPENIIINNDAALVKITNLGVSTLITKDNRNTDNFHRIVGNLSYISPEQTGRMNRSIDYRTDFYSLGVTLYEMLLGIPPFNAEDELGLIYCHLAKQPISPNRIKESIPVSISDIIMKLLEKNPESRYQSILGLINDLKACKSIFEAGENFDNFIVGVNDFSKRFSVPQKLYGREIEIKEMLASFERASRGSVEIMTVSGYSGIGKSSLVNEIHKSVVSHRGIFAVGKYDQLKHDISYSALIQLFEGIIGQIISNNSSTIEKWRLNILDLLGNNGRIITDIIPSLEFIIGPQPKVPDLPLIESQNRFNQVFKNFVKCFCTPEHPLIMFLDDMQWSDLATLKLLDSLIYDKDTSYLMIILTYRDNEAYGTHPLLMTLDNIARSGKVINSINLKPLSKSNVEALLAETLRCDTEKVSELSHLLLKKTEGNPFFLNQLVYLLYQEDLIWIDESENLWHWDLKKIRDVSVTENVVNLMIRKIQKLSKDVQEVLTLAACVGNKFDLKILSFVCKKSSEELKILLNEALIEGLILVDKTTNKASQDDYAEPSYLFLHDRIQQAAYGFIKESNRKNIHLELGRLILDSTNLISSEEKVFDILNHYNLGIDLIADESEKNRLMILELTAGRRAKKAIAYELAYKYFAAGISLLKSDCWITQYDIAIKLYTEAAEAAYLSGNFGETLKLSQVVDTMSKDILDKVPTYEIMIQAYAAQAKIPEAIDYAVKCIRLLGEGISKNPSKARVLFNLVRTKFALGGKDIENLSNLPLMEDKHHSAILSILALIGSISYRADTIFMSSILIQAINIIIKYGNTPDSPFFYSGYGLVCCSLGDIKTGYLFGKLATNLVEDLEVYEQKSRIIFMNNAFISHWKEALRSLLPRFKEGYQCGIEVGDYEFAAYNGFYYCNKSYYAGKNLEELEKEMTFFIEGIKNLKQEPQLHLTQMMCQLVMNLRYPTPLPLVLSGKAYDENTMLPLHFAANDNTAVSSVYIIKLMLCYIFNDYYGAISSAEMTNKYIESLQSTVAIPTYHFYNSLSKLAIYNEASQSAKQEIIKEVSSAQKKMKKWSENCPTNYLHKYYLVEAEKSRVLFNDQRAIDLYNQAIELAASNNFKQDEALAYELLGNYYLSKSNRRLAKFYLETAHYTYTLWGAIAKADQLLEKYASTLLTDIEAGVYKIQHSQVANNKISNASAIIDTATIVKATQAISGEIKLEELLKKLIYILHENSGAQRVFFIMKQDDLMNIVARGNANEDTVEVLENYNIEKFDGIPKKIINYVIHSKQSVIVDNPALDENYMDDTYIAQNAPKSILCMPIINNTKLNGVLYLENNLIEGAFSASRIEILKVLSAQLAISIDNANMYQNLEILNDSLEQKVQRRTEELKELIVKIYSLLDNSGEGFLSFDRDFIIDSEYSSECKLLFGKDITGLNVLELLFNNDQDKINSFVKSINIILETNDDYRRKILLSLLPSLLTVDSRFIKIKYRILENLKVMLIITDITREIKLEEKVKEEQERLKLIVASFVNKGDFLDAIDEYKLFIENGFKSILNSSNNPDEKLAEVYRNVHTFKGVFSQFSFINLPKKLDELENSLTELRRDLNNFEGKVINLFDNSECSTAFETDLKIITDILGDNFTKDRNKIYLDEEKALKLKKAADIIKNQKNLIDNNSIKDALEIMKTLHYKSLKDMLETYPDYTVNLSDRLGKCIYSFDIEGSDIKVDPYKYTSFTKSLIHIFRNAVDHGLESPDERLEAGKDEIGKVSCTISYIDNKISLIIEDDGRGIDPERIKKKAISYGLITEKGASVLERNELINLIFHDSFSTKENITDISGRGYGLSAVLSETKKINGEINIETTLGRGTRFIFSV